ncbi:hypothetical protein K6T82_11345 [Flavobacterium sp. 17A]|uniref:Uncharacterized protein n=2 Tax=Flavobacterium potami TaxID=2872310 RepID=A0A9X1KPZ8_9FLAO|nr:hypothetical protein [Flavobacterium potami]
MKTKSIFCKLLLIIIILIISFIGYKQYQVENYINKQKKIYKILQGKKRINYTPFVIRFLNGELNKTKNYQSESKAFYMPYAMVDLKSVYLDKDFDSYIVYCYFTEEEIVKYYENIKNDSRSPKSPTTIY